jgi:GNAT superfamily N-acetyltransferase
VVLYDLTAEAERWAEVDPALPELLAELARERPHLAQIKIPVAATDLGRVLCANGFYPVETMLALSLPLQRIRRIAERLPAGLVLRDATGADLEALAPIARGAFHADRFHLDARLSAARADERYEIWLRRGFAAGEPVFVLEDTLRRRALGFFHVRALEPGVVDLSLAAVEPAARRLGLGALMYQAVVERVRDLGFRSASTHITVHNTDVLNLFARLGVAFRDPVLCLHRWEGEAPPHSARS